MYQSEMEIMMDNPFGFGNPRCVYNFCLWFMADSLSSAEIILRSIKDVFSRIKMIYLNFVFYFIFPRLKYQYCPFVNRKIKVMVLAF